MSTTTTEERETYLAKAREIIAEHAAGRQPDGALIAWARETLAAAGEAIPEASAAPDPQGGASDPRDTGAIIAGTDAAGRELTLREVVHSGSWAMVKTFTPYGQIVRDLNPDLSATAPSTAIEAKASALGIDVPALKAACKAWTEQHPASPYNFDKALKAEIANQEKLALDLSRTHPVDGMIGKRS